MSKIEELIKKKLLLELEIDNIKKQIKRLQMEKTNKWNKNTTK